MEVPEILFQLHAKAKRIFGSLWRVDRREERVIYGRNKRTLSRNGGIGSGRETRNVGSVALKWKKKSGVMIMYSGALVCLRDEAVPLASFSEAKLVRMSRRDKGEACGNRPSS